MAGLGPFLGQGRVLLGQEMALVEGFDEEQVDHGVHRTPVTLGGVGDLGVERIVQADGDGSTHNNPVYTVCTHLQRHPPTGYPGHTPPRPWVLDPGRRPSIRPLSRWDVQQAAGRDREASDRSPGPSASSTPLM